MGHEERNSTLADLRLRVTLFVATEETKSCAYQLHLSSVANGCKTALKGYCGIGEYVKILKVTIDDFYRHSGDGKECNL